LLHQFAQFDGVDAAFEFVWSEEDFHLKKVEGVEGGEEVEEGSEMFRGLAIENP
jgi:hypothetical protein